MQVNLTTENLQKLEASIERSEAGFESLPDYLAEPYYNHVLAPLQRLRNLTMQAAKYPGPVHVTFAGSLIDTPFRKCLLKLLNRL